MLQTNYNFGKLAEKFEEQFNINIVAILDKSDFSAKKEGEINIIYTKKIKDYIERGGERIKRYKSGNLYINLIDILDIAILVVKDSEKAMEFLNGNLSYLIDSSILEQRLNVSNYLQELMTKYVDSKKIALMYLMNPINKKHSVVNVYEDIMRLCFANYIIVNNEFPRSILSSLPKPIVDKKNIKGSLHNEAFKQFVNDLVTFVIKGDYRTTDEYSIPDNIEEYMEQERLYLTELCENMSDRQFNYKELEEVRGIAYSIIEQVNAIKVIKSNKVDNME